MNRHSLRTRILLFSVLPVLIIGIGMTAFFSLNRYSQLNNTLISKARSIIYPLSTSASFALTEKSVPLLQGLVNEAARNDARNIVAISIFDQKNKMLVTSSIAPETELFKLAPENQEYIYTKESTEFTDDGIIMRMPIYGYDPKAMLTLYGNFQRSPETDEQAAQQKTPIFADPKLNYPREIAGYICIYFLRDQTVMDVYQDITIAVIILLFSLLVSVLLAINLNKRIVDPINSLCSAVYEIREGNVTARVNGMMTGELERLRTYVNSMANAMSELHSEMQYNVDTTTNDLRYTLEKLEQQNNDISEANIRAQNAARIKSEFLANMSHELRTPLNGILGFAKQMYKSRLSLEQTDYLNTIERSANNLLRIVNNILDFSKLEAGKLTFENIPFSLRNACCDTIHLLSPIAIEKGLELTFTTSPAVPDSVLGDPIRFQQILTNLIGNAIKFTSKGNVALSVELKDQNGNISDIVFTVKDTGIGIKDEQQQELFTAFTQADSSINRRYGGTGLGLVITKHLIEQYHGSITLESKVGIGTTFTFDIQLENAAENNVPQMYPALVNRKVAIVDVNTWVKDSVDSLLKNMGLLTFPMSNPLPINTLPEQNELDYIIIGLQAGFDYNKLLYYFTSIKQEVLNKVERIVFAVNTLDPEIHNQLRQLNPKVTILVKPILADKLIKALTEPLSVPVIAPSQSKLPTVAESPRLNLGPTTEKQLIKATVLAVDDNSANLKLISTLLKEIVTDVYTAENGQEAVELCSHTEFNLIFMDIQMPVMDGLDAMREIHKNSVNQSTPIIAVSALVIKEEQQRFIQEGMADYLAKPLEEQQLKDLIYRYCGQNETLSMVVNTSDVAPKPQSQIQLADDDPQAVWTKTRALKQTAGHKDLALEMLSTLVSSVPDLLLILAHPEQLAIADLAKTVHKFAGGAAYCGMPGVKKLCNIIESALKNGQGLEDIEPELFELTDIVQTIQENGPKWLKELT